MRSGPAAADACRPRRWSRRPLGAACVGPHRTGHLTAETRGGTGARGAGRGGISPGGAAIDAAPPARAGPRSRRDGGACAERSPVLPRCRSSVATRALLATELVVLCGKRDLFIHRLLRCIHCLGMLRRWRTLPCVAVGPGSNNVCVGAGRLAGSVLSPASVVARRHS